MGQVRGQRIDLEIRVLGQLVHQPHEVRVIWLDPLVEVIAPNRRMLGFQGEAGQIAGAIHLQFPGRQHDGKDRRLHLDRQLERQPVMRDDAAGQAVNLLERFAIQFERAIQFSIQRGIRVGLGRARLRQLSVRQDRAAQNPLLERGIFHRIGRGMEGISVEVIRPLETGNFAPRIGGPIDEGEIAAPHARQEIRENGRWRPLPLAEFRIRVKICRREKLHWPGPPRERREIVERLVQPDVRREAVAQLRGDVNQRSMHSAQGFRLQFVPELVVVTQMPGVDADPGGLRRALEPGRAHQCCCARRAGS